MVEDPGLLAMFGAALGLVPPWQVTSVIFDKEAGKLEIGLDFPRGSRFACPIECCRESACPVHDTAEKTWRHLDFFEHQAFLAARVPRVNCGEHGIHLIAVPWARPGSGFTLLMEVAMLTFAKQMPIAPLAEMAREHDTRVWRVVEHHVAAVFSPRAPCKGSRPRAACCRSSLRRRRSPVPDGQVVQHSIEWSPAIRWVGWTSASTSCVASLRAAADGSWACQEETLHATVD